MIKVKTQFKFYLFVRQKDKRKKSDSAQLTWVPCHFYLLFTLNFLDSLPCSYTNKRVSSSDFHSSLVSKRAESMSNAIVMTEKA